ncbi:MAG TPA: hypothetical protein VMY35_02755 [Phycisphaerae bacterium]|nr:hypothetical protein [Phycisphaerae bacterium]
MAEARGRLEWAQTAEVLCVLYNAHRDPTKRPRPFRAEEFSPYGRPGRRAETPPDDMATVKAAVLAAVGKGQG